MRSLSPSVKGLKEKPSSTLVSIGPQFPLNDIGRDHHDLGSCAGANPIAQALAFLISTAKTERDFEAVTLFLFNDSNRRAGANDVMGPIHNRMQVILGASDREAWLDPDMYNPNLLESILKPCPDECLEHSLT